MRFYGSLNRRARFTILPSIHASFRRELWAGSSIIITAFCVTFNEGDRGICNCSYIANASLELHIYILSYLLGSLVSAYIGSRLFNA